LNQSAIISYSKDIGLHDGAMAYFYAVAFNKIRSQLNSTQMAALNAIRATQNLPTCNGYYYFSWNYVLPKLSPDLVSYFFSPNGAGSSFLDVAGPPTGSIVVLSPTHASTILIGGSITVTWVSGGLSGQNVSIFLFYGATLVQVLTSAQGTPALAQTFIGTISPSIAQSLVYRVQVVDAVNPVNFGFSSQFSTKGSISVSPCTCSGSLSCVVGQALSITWTAYGLPSKNVVLVLYKDGKQTSTSTTAVASASHYAWSTFGWASGNYSVKIADSVSITTSSSSPYFTVRGYITLTAPALSLHVSVGGSLTISWSSGGLSSGFVDLYLLNQNGLRFNVSNVPVLSTSSSTSYTTMLSNKNLYKGQYQVFVVDHGLPLTQGNTSFYLTGLINVISPVAAMTPSVGGVLNVTWIYRGGSEASTVALFLYQSGALKQILIPSVSASLGTYIAKINSTIVAGAGFTVKVADTDGSTFGVSAPFTVIGAITVTSPTNLTVGYTQRSIPVTWSALGLMGTTVTISLYNGASLVQQVKSVAAFPPSYDLTLMNNLPKAATYQVLVADSKFPSGTFGYSSFFTISGQISISSPIASTTAIVGGALTVSWTVSGTTSLVAIVLYENGNAVKTVTSPTFTAPKISTFQLAINNTMTKGTGYQVVILDAEDPTVSARSSLFTIYGSIAVVSPVSGASFPFASPLSIQWTYLGQTPATVNPPTTVAISLFKGMSQTPCQTLTISVLASSGSFQATLSKNLTEASNYYIKIYDGTNPPTSGTSLLFSVLGQISIVSPLATSVFTAGGFIAVSWTAAGLSGSSIFVYLYQADNQIAILSKNGVSPLSVKLLSGLGKASNYYVVVTDGLSSTSSPRFMITGAFTPTTPTGNLYIGSSLTASWTFTGLTNKVNVALYNANAGGSVQTLASNILATSGTCTATVAVSLPKGSSYQIMVADAADSTVFGLSSTFTLLGAINVTSPAPIKCGSSVTVTWSYMGSSSSSNISAVLYQGNTMKQTLCTGLPPSSRSCTAVYSAGLQTSKMYRVLVKDSTPPGTSAYSPTFFCV